MTKIVSGVVVQSGSKAYELFESKDPIDQKKAKLLVEFCKECSKANYEYSTVQKLREKYKDII